MSTLVSGAPPVGDNNTTGELLHRDNTAICRIGKEILYEIVAFHPSEFVSRRVYDLISAERAGKLSDGEERELKTYLYLEHFMRMMKAEVHRRLADPERLDERRAFMLVGRYPPP